MLIRGVGLFGRTLLEMAKRLGRNIADELRGEYDEVPGSVR
jgi:hypothetical protein